MPSYEAFQDEEAGKIKLGGCVRELDEPKWHCRSCEQSKEPAKTRSAGSR